MSGTTFRRQGARALVGGIAALTLAACGGSSVIVRLGPPGSTLHAPAGVPTNPVTGSASTSPSMTPSAPRNPTITVAPSTGLADGQQVHVVGTGFSPGESLQAIECADKGDKTGPGDCDLASARSTQADATGTVSIELTVHRGPFGINRIVCGQPLGCLVSVTQASLAPTEEADAPVTFR